MGKIVVKDIEPCNPAQREFILGELSRLHKSTYDYKREPLPASLRAAQDKLRAVSKKITAYNAAQDRLIKQRVKTLDRKLAAIRKTVHFGSAATALKMLEALQAEQANAK